MLFLLVENTISINIPTYVTKCIDNMLIERYIYYIKIKFGVPSIK